MTYRKDIDFLRAVAMIGIFLYHMSVNVVSGGFVFLELFFVISGFLITSIILSALAKEKFSIKRFYVNRFFRLFPALIVTLCCVVIWGYFVLGPSHFKELAKSALTAILSVSNFYFWQSADYFDISKYSKPLLHTWSLGVEEQYYLIWPALIALTYRFRPSSKVFYALLAFLFAASLCVSIQWSHNETKTAAAYFLLPSRIFEFALGAILAVAWLDIDKRIALGTAPRALVRVITFWQKPRLADLLFISGLLVLFLSAVTFDESWGFPGYIALVPCGSALMCLMAGQRSAAAQWLSSRFMVLTGQISYSLYLVHWPIIVYYKYGRSEDLEFGDKAFIFGLAYALALLLHVIIEQPFRQKTGPLSVVNTVIGHFSRRRSAVICASLAALCALTNAHIIKYDGWAFRINNDMQAVLSDVENDYQNRQIVIRAPECHYNDNAETIEDYLSRFETCNPSSKLESGAPNILLIGDSHAADIYASLSYARPDVNIIQLTKAGCYVDTDLDRPGNNCAAMHRFARQYLEANAAKIDGVIFKIRGEILYSKDETAFKGLRHFLINPAKTYLESLQSFGTPIVWLGPNVEYTADFRQILERSETLSQALETAAADRRWEEVESLDAELTALFKESSVSYISSREICGGPCPLTTDDGTPITPDYGHWGYMGAQYMSRYLLEAPEIKRMAK